jgi:hypothetical protein
LDVVINEEKDENILRLKTPQPIKKNRIIEKPRIDFIETWFQRLVGQEIPSNSQHIWFSFSPAHFGHAPNSLVLSSIYLMVLEFIPHIIWILEWLHWKYTYT